MLRLLYRNKFALFFFSELAILFGSLVFPPQFFEESLMPLLFLVNIASGILLISGKRFLFWFYIALFSLSLIIYGFDTLQRNELEQNIAFRFSMYFMFYSTVTISIIKQVWHAKKVDKDVIIGLMSGYVSLGFLAFFMFTAIELYHPNSFDGILISGMQLIDKLDSLLYYSYITLLTIGYGEIVPVTPVAQKASVLIGLVGQFYTVIITAVVVEKYIRHSVKES